MNIGKGAEAMKDTMDSILEMIMAELIRVFIVQASVQAIKSWGGARAEGGPVSAGKPYLVGEKGIIDCLTVRQKIMAEEYC